MSDAEQIADLVERAYKTESLDESVSLLVQAHNITIRTEETLDPAMVEQLVVSLNDAQAVRHTVIREAALNRDRGPEFSISEERMAQLREENERDRAAALARQVGGS